MAKALLDILNKQFPGVLLESHSQHGDETAVVDPAFWREIAKFLRDSPLTSMEMLVDLTCVDFPDNDPRFEVVAHLLSLSKGHRLRLKARVGSADGDDAVIDSLTELWGSANWAEREAWDMFGVRFEGHPDLRRILMWDEFVDYPMRKDYREPDDYEYEPTPHDDVLERAKQHYTPRPQLDGAENITAQP